ncbi:MAG: EAL domain-containing protein, partial [Gammaproteobacteria bacterium]|nr:EAL domain-containing protein [Gammaproteobacteria bacterium]
LDSSLPMHFEILVRLVNDDGTIVPPGKFLPAAERYNLSPAIDLWVIEKVIAQLKESREQGKKLTGQYNINLSGVSIGSPHFNQKLIELIRDNAELGPYLCFEITETSAIANISNAQWLMQELRTFNCQFALDDFGSGLSSFSYLKQLPIDYLKVDGVFVKDCLTDPVNLAMLQSFHDISKVMGIKTVAEYVETEAIYKKLQQLGIDYAQGYWVGEPTLWEMDK